MEEKEKMSKIESTFWVYSFLSTCLALLVNLFADGSICYSMASGFKYDGTLFAAFVNLNCILVIFCVWFKVLWEISKWLVKVGGRILKNAG